MHAPTVVQLQVSRVASLEIVELVIGWANALLDLVRRRL
jgi:hypothetical protein